ncbi:hypothetical protein BAY01_12855 [Elizabethkingia miricola]|nr:hypothetical protein BAY01_12855 [Elizabethkingia miricola]OPC34661.1 hypothetical protein BAX99_07290 [Elizabethkingia miricola]
MFLLNIVYLNWYERDARTSGRNEDHKSLNSNNKNHPGVNKYNQIKNELIKINPNYKKEFKNTENEQQQ